MNMRAQSAAISMSDATRLLTAPGALYEMETQDVRGTPTRVYKHAPSSLRAIFDASRNYGARECLVYRDERITFEQHWRAATALGHAFSKRFGIRKGDRVAIAMRNYPEWAISFWAAAAIGAVVTPLNAWGTGADIAHGLEDSGATLILLDNERMERLAPLLPDLDVRVIIARADHAEATRLDALIGPASAYGELPDTPLPDPGLLPEDNATIFYTSGTTGRPKAALGTHRNITTNLLNASFRAARASVRRGQRAPRPGDPPAAQRTTLLPVPLFHVTGCHSTLVPCLAAGTKLVMMHKWNAEDALALIEAERVSAMGGVPSMIWQLLETAAVTHYDLTSLDTLGSGGAAASADMTHLVRAAFPNAMLGQGYGATETSSIVASIYGEDQLEHPDSVGPPAPICDVRIVTANNGDAMPGEAGELWVRGANVVSGYRNDPESTAAAFKDGWYRTGDIVRQDTEGCIIVLDRTKDMIIRGGENIYCVEVENALAAHPAVAEAALIGMPHRTLGEEVGAVVRTRSECSAAALRAHLQGQVAAFKIPIFFLFRTDEFPRNASGKVLKTALRDELLQAREAS